MIDKESYIERIKEIMDEQGFTSVEAFSEVCGVNKEYIRQILKGSRDIGELEAKIAYGLGVTVRRLRMEDTREQIIKAENDLLLPEVNIQELIKSVNVLYKKAIGITEKADMLYLLSSVYKHGRLWNECVQTCEDALQLLIRQKKAKSMSKIGKRPDGDRIRKVISRYLFALKSSQRLHEYVALIEKYEQYFDVDARAKSELLYRKGNAKFRLNYWKEAEDSYNSALEGFRVLNDKEYEFRILVNIAMIYAEREFYVTAIDILNEAEKLLQYETAFDSLMNYQYVVAKILFVNGSDLETIEKRLDNAMGRYGKLEGKPMLIYHILKQGVDLALKRQLIQAVF